MAAIKRPKYAKAENQMAENPRGPKNQKAEKSIACCSVADPGLSDEEVWGLSAEGVRSETPTAPKRVGFGEGVLPSPLEIFGHLTLRLLIFWPSAFRLLDFQPFNIHPIELHTQHKIRPN